MDSTEEFFWARVVKTETCWEWSGNKQAYGHGVMHFQGQRRVAARYAWELLRGPLPEGSHVIHLCHKPECVNPDHLKATGRDEAMSNRKGAHTNSKTGVRGVYWHKKNNSYEAAVRLNGKVAWRKSFYSLDEAAEAVAEARRRIFEEPGGD